MIAVPIALICMAGIIIVFFAKLLNLFKNFEGKPLYDAKMVWIGMALSILFLSGYFISLMNAIGMEDVITASTGTEYTLKNNEYYSLVNYFIPLVLMLFFIGVMTIAELVFSVSTATNRMGESLNRLGG